MTLQTTIASIDALYPVAGKDNDSQGFRDNFNYIKTALTTVDGEIIALQTNTILTNNLINGDPVDNDLAGSSINNGFYNNFHGVSYITNAAGAVDVDIRSGSLQQFTLSGNTSFTLKFWPVSSKYAVVRIHFKSNGLGTWTPSIYAAGGGDVVLESNFPDPFTVAPGLVVPADGPHQVIEAWSYNNGATVYVRHLGEF